MAPITVRPTQVDIEIAHAIAARTGPRTEQAAELITWGQMSTFSAHWRSDGGCIRGQEIPHLAERATTS
jgi:hypothetical protein